MSIGPKMRVTTRKHVPPGQGRLLLRYRTVYPCETEAIFFIMLGDVETQVSSSLERGARRERSSHLFNLKFAQKAQYGNRNTPARHLH